MKLCLAVLLTVGFIGACKARTSTSGVLDQPQGGTPNDGIPLWTEDAVLGATDDTTGPVVTRIVIGEGEAPIERTFVGGSEYWLYGTTGRGLGLMTFSDRGNYRVYQNSRPCEELQDPNWCNLVPSEMARRCMRQASNTLEAIRASGDMPDTGGLGFFGWINDGAAIPGGRANGGIWVWNESLIKWVGSVSSDGVCRTPSLSDLKALLASRP
jgi:hypothetical protein